MQVLVACEESQAVTKEFRAKGHEAYSCDIQDCSGGHPEWHCKEDVLPLLNGNCTFKTCDGKEHTIDGKWDMVIGFPPCFVAGTQVLTDKGYKSIEEIQVGDMVLTHKGRYRRVYDVMSKPTDKLAMVNTGDSGLIMCTLNHPFYTKDEKHMEDGFKWVSPDMFTTDTLVSSICDDSKDIDVPFNEDEMYLIGYWFGGMNNADLAMFESTEESDSFPKVKEKLSKLGYTYHYEKSNELVINEAERFKQLTKEFREEDETLYDEYYDKLLKPEHLHMPYRKALAFVQGFLDSPQMTHDSYLELKYIINKNLRATCALTVYGIKVNINPVIDERYLLSPVRIKVVEKNTTVYNISVEEDESYTADGIIVHNCTHLAVSGAAHFAKKRADGRQRDGIEFFCKFFDIDCDKVAIENPVNIISGDYIPKWFPDIAEKYSLPRKPTQKIQPWYWGDNVVKTTCLWLKGLPELVPEVTEEPEIEYFEFVSKKTGQKKRQSKWYYDALKETPENRSKIRSKTFPGVAREMANRWG